MFNIDKDYIIKLRREIHMYPEIDFDLPKTVALVKRELESMGIPYTEQYGKGSIVGYINPDKKGFTIGLRADMDALKVTEETDLPFKSKNEGLMHACGHDAHTAILLGTAKALKSIEHQLNCRVKLLFQPSEEGIKSGAVMMVEKGALDDVAIVAGLHVSSTKTGTIGVRPGPFMASSRHFKIEIFGKNAHAATPHKGIDSIAVAFRLYSALQLLLSREVDPLQQCLCSINKIEGGTAQNIVAENCVMLGTMRTYDMEVSNYLFERINKIADSLANELGIEIKVTGPVKSVCTYNNPYVAELLRLSAIKAVGEENVFLAKQKMGSEDFSRMQEKRPGVFFTLGTDSKYPAHNGKFDINEEGLHLGAKVFVQFVIDNQNGIDMEKV
ncbi:MAG: amidohydrolase [Clostridia bacterium]|nr:amidohydrolase [Clostridia bacterium]